MPSKRQFTVILSERALAAVQAREGGCSRSAVVSSIVERYADLMAGEVEGLDIRGDERALIARILEPYPSPGVMIIQALGAMLAMKEGNPPDDLPGVRLGYLMALLESASATGRVAVVDQIERGDY